MKPALRSRYLPLLLLACTACGDETHVDISTITNETAHQAAAEVAKETEAITAIDSLPKEVADPINASQTQRQNSIQQGLKESKYANMSDRRVDSLRQAWLAGYSRTCDPAEYDRINSAIQTDEVLKQWSGQNTDSAIAYHARLVAAKTVCESGPH